jgi:hypothetical protein
MTSGRVSEITVPLSNSSIAGVKKQSGTGWSGPTGILIASLFFFLLSCQNPADVLSTGGSQTGTQPSDTQPSAAGLAVVEISPKNGATDVNPGQLITIKFNKPLDTTWLQQSATTVVSTIPPLAPELSFDSATNTLTATVRPYLDPNQTYTLTLSSGVKAESGDTLSQTVTWGFTTGDGPAGDVQIVANRFNGNLYTSADSVTLNIQCNFSATSMKLASTADDLAGAPLQPVSSGTYTQNWDLQTAGPQAESPQTVYAQFGHLDVLSAVRKATVIRDKTNPIARIALPPKPYYNASTTPVALSASASTDANGIAEYSWIANPPGVHFNPEGGASPAITISGSDSDYTISLRVKDPAGNWSAQTEATVWKDTSVPATPIVAAAGWGATAFQQTSLRPTWVLPRPGLTVNPPNIGPDVYFVQVDNHDLEQISLPSRGDTYTSPTDLDDNSDHTLIVWQQDAAGNRSDPTIGIRVHISPVIPANGSDVSPGDVTLQWRDFSSSYTVHFGKNNAGAYQPLSESAPQGGTSWTVSVLSSGVQYLWFVEGAQGSGTRVPNELNTYYSFQLAK